MATTYDDVWAIFISKCPVDERDLPQSDEAIYQVVNNAASEFNIRLDRDLKADDTSETFSEPLTKEESLLFAHLIRLSILENQLIYFSTTFSPFTKEIGARNLGNQMNRLEALVDKEEKKIVGILVGLTDEFV